MKKTVLSLCAVALCSWSAHVSHAYNDTITHKSLSEAAITQSRADLTIKNELLFPLGVQHAFGGQKVLDATKEGARLEDEPACRASNHFHNPLNFQSWAEAYMSDMPRPIEWYCEMGDFATNRSAVTWATGYLAPSPEGAPLATNNQWNWDWARYYYRQALTARTAAEREQAYAQMFRALGQVLHLVQDMGVPAHARNDFMAHLKFAEINGWDPTKWFANPYEYYVKMNDARVALHPAVYPAFARQPISLTDFWDTNRYDAGCATPGARRSGRDLGLAEYTNANFLSDSTIFTEGKPCDDIRFFPHPRLDETDFNPEQWPLKIYNAEDGRADTMRLVSITDTEGLAAWEAPTRAVAAVRYLARYLQEEDPSSFQYYERNFYLNPDDDAVHRNTADRLLPRAVGYSAALLDYFFRGRFEPTDAQTPLVVAISGSTVTVSFRNASGEDMRDGTIELYQDSGEGAVAGSENHLVSLATLGFDWFVDGDSHSFENIAVTVPPGKSLEDLVFTLVFRGRLGAETGAVVAKRFVGPVPPDVPSVINVGDNPHGMALTPLRDKLYVTNYSANTVSVIGTAQRQVVATIPVGSGPTDVAIAGNRAFVSNERGNSVSVIDIASDTVETTISGLPPSPEEMAVTPDGNDVYLAHWSNRPLTRINTATLAYDLIPSPSRPCQGIAIRDTAAYLTYYTFYWRKSVGVVDLSTLGLAATIPGPDLNWSAATSGTRLFVAHPQVNAVSAYDTTSNTLIGTLPVAGSPRGVAAGSDGMVYVARLLDDKVSVINASTNTLADEIAAGDGAYDVVVDNQAGYLYVSNAFADTVSVIPLGGGVTPLMAMAGASLSAATPAETSSLATVMLNDFPPDGRVLIDGEFPRGETWFETGREILMTPGSHELLLACPGYLTKAIAVNGLPGEYMVEDGLLAAE